MTTKTDIIYSIIRTKLIYEIRNGKKAKEVSSSLINLLLLNFLLIRVLIFFSLFIKSNHYQYITLKINKTGNLKIFFVVVETSWPDEVWINNINKTKVKNEYYINDTNDIIKLIWYNKPNSIDSYFTGCSDITEIDFSNFDTSTYKSMSNLFGGCESLQRVNLSNLNTSLVTNMNLMFSDCSSLTSLDLSNFKTSEVISMNSMFEGCLSLIYLNLSNFNTSLCDGFSNMFYNCWSLSSLIFPYFNMTKASYYYENILNGCSNLKLLNLKEAQINNAKIQQLLNTVPNDIKKYF